MMKKVYPIVAVLSLLISLLAALITLSHAQLNDEALALLNIKQAVGLQSPKLASWSSNGDPCADKWVGVTCDISQKYVIGLNMSGFNLKGILPNDVFSKLTSLRSLDFFYNQLESPFPSLDNLKNLHDLNFSENFFTGPFPETIFNLPNLVELRFDQNNLTGPIPEGISNLKLLEQIWLGGSNRFTSPLPKGLAALPKVKTLTLWGSTFKENLPPEWAIWVNLTYLNLHGTMLSGNLPSEWGPKLTKLQRLLLYNNHLTGKVPDSWKGMISLNEFRLRDNFLSGPAPSWFSQLANAGAWVDLSCNFLSGPYPQWFNDSSTWKGNCFDSDSRAHDERCIDGFTCTSGPTILGTNKKDQYSIGGMVGIMVAVAVSSIVFAICYVWWSRIHNAKRLEHRIGKDLIDWVPPKDVKRYTLKEIRNATKSFDKSCEIGGGAFGKVYVANLEDGKTVAIKRAGGLTYRGTKEFQNEISLLSRLHNPHLVGLEGFCRDRDEQIIVYEYMINGSLHFQLFEKDAVNLNWYRRLQIALAVAEGLDYLHSSEPPIIHRDIKLCNILLDDKFNAKVSDFGISKPNLETDTHVSTGLMGTAGYLDPEYFVERQLSTATDIYAYGVVLFELITGQHAIDTKRLEDYNIVGWAKSKLVEKGVEAIIDPRLGSNVPVGEYSEVVKIAASCTAFERGDRPTMQNVASTLERLLSGLIPPPEHSVAASLPSDFTPQTSDVQRNVRNGRVEPLTDVKIEFGFKDINIEPR
ncbi:hypothetical protein KP509_38G029700 [Ceratopteris richardii]|uniref:Protein kinase domain-containing protein n=1 Tax=Ceratopteris richardii TaxID=49495 RepID=A0A8T2Q2V9_CERRI|nr:hypothetical protein KP509_38G029700 [Ceratopteris richardii]KAH7278210.1 hypothetical protein KP509_38G029700 [Ceratopteris richardii]KAH7278212.1 hypothetical protein KP509_38G029700 [Ceratopteris richardii]